MNGIAKVAVGAAVAVGIGAAATFASRPLYEKLGESFAKGQYKDIDERYAALKPGDGWIPGPSYDEADGYVTVMIPTLSAFGVVGAGLGAANLLGKGSIASGLGLAALTGALVGNSVGYIMGASRGSSSVHAQYGVDIDSQAKNLIGTYDTSGNGTLELDPAGRPAGEYLRQTTYRDLYTGQDVTSWTSVEHATRAADASGDGVVTTSEAKALFTKFDANSDGLLQSEETSAFTAAGNERSALVEVIPKS